MPLRFVCSIILILGLTSCLGLKPRPDNTKLYALGLTNLAQSSPTISFEKGYVARPQLPVYMEGTGLKLISDDKEIVTVSNARWAESIDVGVARSMSHYIENLDSSLRSDFYPWIRTAEVAFVLQLNFDHLIATSDGRIFISASWNYEHTAGVTKTGVFVNNTIEWSPGDVPSMIKGINTALSLLANEIVDSLKKEALTTK